MTCRNCYLSARNSIHTDSRRYDHHAFVAPPEELYVPTLSERVEDLERRIGELEELLTKIVPTPLP